MSLATDDSPKILQITEFGNTTLRETAHLLTVDEIQSQKIKQLIQNLRHTLTAQKLGVGLAAPQVGEGLAISVISVLPTAHRPLVEPLELVIINPEITTTFGKRTQMWEGCISSGSGQAGLFGKTLRYKKVEVTFLDEHGNKHVQIFEGLPAQIMQHEIDHLNGILFVDKVKDPKTYMTMSEYKKMTLQVDK
jgi:peptide deformylase